MNAISKIESWADRHHPQWIDFLRIVLGLFFMYKGVLFISDSGAQMDLMEE